MALVPKKTYKPKPKEPTKILSPLEERREYIRTTVHRFAPSPVLSPAARAEELWSVCRLAAAQFDAEHGQLTESTLAHERIWPPLVRARQLKARNGR